MSRIDRSRARVVPPSDCHASSRLLAGARAPRFCREAVHAGSCTLLVVPPRTCFYWLYLLLNRWLRPNGPSEALDGRSAYIAEMEAHKDCSPPTIPFASEEAYYYTFGLKYCHRPPFFLLFSLCASSDTDY